MFSKKATNPYDFLNQTPNPQTIRNRVSVIRNHFTTNERLHRKERQLLLDNIQQAPNDGIREVYELELHFHEHFFERVHRVSTLLILYSLLENLMAKICKKKAEVSGMNFEPKRYSIFEFRSYLEKSPDIRFSAPEIEKHWAIITKLNNLRNAFAHSEGDLEQYGHFAPDKIKKLVRIVNDTPGLSLYSKTIMVSSEYVEHNITAVEDLLLAVQKD
ncbi:hypothetical protein [Photobacterium leiognathi]|uniref:hypothetical protein n=1 Tax=Photobacterium leiognathi TaxID=553611 RepID=UPI003AF355E6